MQLIRAINKSNKSNNNKNQTSSGGHFSKVVIAAPPATKSSVSQQQPQAPASPSVALPALKKRTAVVKQSVPPPVPPRGSPRSKSKCIGVSSSRRKSTIDVSQLASLSDLEESGCQKVKQWLETVEVPDARSSIPETVEFKSVKKLAENFTQRDQSVKKSSKSRCKVSDLSVVRIRVESYDSLATCRLRYLKSSDAGTDSGIDIPARAISQTADTTRKHLQTFGRFSHDEEFV